MADLDYRTCRSYQKALGIEPPDRVLWAALAEALPTAAFQAVQRAHFKAAQRYQRASNLNQMARWVRAVERRTDTLDKSTARKMEAYRATLADPLAYVNARLKKPDSPNYGRNDE